MDTSEWRVEERDGTEDVSGLDHWSKCFTPTVIMIGGFPIPLLALSITHISINDFTTSDFQLEMSSDKGLYYRNTTGLLVLKILIRMGDETRDTKLFTKTVRSLSVKGIPVCRELQQIH